MSDREYGTEPKTAKDLSEQAGHVGNENIQHNEEGEELNEGKISFKLVMHTLAIVSAYFATNAHLVGSGVLSQTVAEVVGGRDKATWIPAALTFHPVVLGPPICKAADFWGRKWFMVITLLLGAAGCVVTSRATSIGIAIAGQVISGFAGINQALPQAITSEILPRRYRSWAQVAINTPGAAAALIGVLLTGALTKNNREGFRDYWYFLAALYFCAACTVAYFYRPPPRETQLLALKDKLHQLDLIGCFLLTVSLLLIVLALEWSNNPYEWTNAHVLAPFLVGIAAAAALILYAIFYRKDGLFHHKLFKSRNFVIGEICLIGEGVTFIAANNYLGFQLVAMYGDDSWRVALTFSVAWCTWIFTAPVFGWFIARTRQARLVVILSLASFVIYFSLMAATNPSTRTNIWGYNVFLGLGLAGGILALITVTQLSIPPELIAPATGIIVATRTLGASIGLVIFNAIFNAVVSDNIGPTVGTAAVDAGLPRASVEALIGALLNGSPAALGEVPGVNDEIIGASTQALKHVYNLGFRDGYASAVAFSALAMIAAFFLRDPTEEYTTATDAPLKEKTKVKTVEEAEE